MTCSQQDGQNDEVVLFVTNGDGTVTCSWCEIVFPADEAVPDGHDEPICRECYLSAIHDEQFDSSEGV